MRAGKIFEFAAGLFLCLALLKWGTPVILDYHVDPPTNWDEFLYFSWPVSWGYCAFIPVVLAGLWAMGTSSTAPIQSKAGSSGILLRRIVCLLPLVWLGWQFLSATGTVDATLTRVTLKNFTLCATMFYLGYLALRHRPKPVLFWILLSLGLCLVLREGMDQHFGQQEATRRYFYREHAHDWWMFSPELIKRMNGDRIFGTLFYPNALAGTILLLLPLLIAMIWEQTRKLSRPFRLLLAGLFCDIGLLCLFWSGSKSAWLISVVLGAITLWQSDLGKRWKRWIIAGFVVVTLAGFGLKYAHFFEKGATSVAARFDYWNVGVKSAMRHPFLGSGPGTFFIQYQQLKRPDAEMTRLCHNDYLEQASDSGLPGFLFYAGLVFLPLFMAARHGFIMNGQFELVPFALWLGLLGWAMHSFVEFPLYIPALGWTAFFLLGWLAQWNYSNFRTAPPLNSIAKS